MSLSEMQLSFYLPQLLLIANRNEKIQHLKFKIFHDIHSSKYFMKYYVHSECKHTMRSQFFGK